MAWERRVVLLCLVLGLFAAGNEDGSFGGRIGAEAGKVSPKVAGTVIGKCQFGRCKGAVLVCPAYCANKQAGGGGGGGGGGSNVCVGFCPGQRSGDRQILDMSLAAPCSPSPLTLTVRKLVDADLNHQIATSTSASPSSASPTLHRTAFADLRQSWASLHGLGHSSLGKGVSFSHSLSSCLGPCKSYCPAGGSRRGPSRVFPERKRPAKLDIPDSARLASSTKVEQFIQNSEATSNAQNVSVHQYGTELYAVASKQGRKELMEDFYTASTHLSGDAKQAFFGVFDGHGGKHAAEFAANNLGRHVSAIINDVDSNPCVEDAMRTAYRNADIEFLNQHVSSGACAVSVLVKEGEMIVANAGDCKAVLCRDGKAESLSICHRASNQTERQRVEDLGGIVECCHGIWRVQGTLAVTKSLGDASLKRWISAEPASKRMVITQEYEFLILASDGLWDKMSDQEAVDCVRKVLNEAEDNMDVDVMTPTSNIQSSENHVSSILLPIQHEDHSLQASGVKQKACNELIRIACQRGNRDDITVMIVPVDVFALS